jgi:ferric-dicitrate binding protein FerR (iron transport regulator)
MDKNRFFYLIDQVNKGVATSEELAEYDAYLNRLTEHPVEWDAAGLGEEAQTREELRALINRQVGQPTIRHIRLWPRIAAAASIIVILSAGGYLLLHKESPKQETATLIKNDIAPGHNQATLTLANGRKIILTKGLSGKLARQGQTQINVIQDNVVYNASNQTDKQISYNTLSTARGEQSPYPLILADGTKVWLNAESSITFPTAFNSPERLVKVTGEAFFEVVHNDKQPFKVQTPQEIIEDIGTQFDVKAYVDEPATKTTLLEGAVKIAPNKIAAAMLKPGEQAILSPNGLEISKANLTKAVAWKNEEFRFADDDIRTIMRELARWYDIEVVYKGEVTDEVFYAKLSRHRNISAALRVLERTKGIHFKVEGRRVTVIQ